MGWFVVRYTGGTHAGRGRRTPGLIVATALAIAGPSLAQIGPNTFLVSVGETTGSGSEDMVFFGPGLGELVVTDLVQLRYDDPRFKDCDMGILEWRRRDWILKEYELQNSPYIDPDAAPLRGKAPPPEPAALIEGSVSDAADTISWSYTMRDRASGRVLAKSEGSLPTEKVMDISEIIALDMMKAACPQGWDASGGGARIQVTGHVARLDAPFQLTGVFSGGTAVFEYAPGSEMGGTVTYSFSGGGVSGGGAGSFTVAQTGQNVYQIQQTTNGCVNGVPNSCRSNSETITLTPALK